MSFALNSSVIIFFVFATAHASMLVDGRGRFLDKLEADEIGFSDA
jgi:hypothetical protein